MVPISSLVEILNYNITEAKLVDDSGGEAAGDDDSETRFLG